MAQLTRREWHKLALGGVAAAAAGILPGTTRRAASAQAESRFAGVLIGLQSYSFRDLSLDDGIAAMQQLGITSCELWEGHVEPAELRLRENRERLRRWRTTIPLDYFEEIRWQFEDAGIEINSYNLSFQDHFSDAEIDRGFEMAQMLGAPAITASAHMNSVPRIARYADRYGIPVAMHNHSRVDPNEFSSPDDFARAIEMGGRAPIAVNLDIGHMVAANHDPIRLPEGQLPAHRHPPPEGPQAERRPEHAVGRGRHPDPRDTVAAARRGLEHPGEHRVRVPGRGHGHRDRPLSRLLQGRARRVSAARG